MGFALLFSLLAAVSASAGAAGVVESAIGVTPDGAPIPSLVSADDFDYHTGKTRVLLVGSGTADSVRRAVEWFYNAPQAAAWRKRFAVSAVPQARPESGFPQGGEAYGSSPEADKAYLWRWIGMHAPDLVVVVDAVDRKPAPDSLAEQLGRSAPAGVGTIPSRTVAAKGAFLPALLEDLAKSGFRGPSPARREIQKRLARKPGEVARQLAVPYGHALDEAVYIPAVALIGRLRLGAVADVERIVEPYVSGQKPSLGPKPTGSHLSGHLVFGELARLTGKPRYTELVRAAADLGFDEGRPREAMPLHNEMSDAVFMGGPILAHAGRLTGEAKYFDMAVRNTRFMLKLNLRADGLHRHSPLDETAWGRGNGFPALGLALILSELPATHPDREEILRAFRAHMEALLAHQDPTGAWHQVIDRPESYRELTATCMIGFAMLRGVRSGWLDKAKYRKAIDGAWNAAKTRIAADGTLVDVCTGTGKQRSLRDYYDRTAILGKDPRGGAMALLFATEKMQ